MGSLLRLLVVSIIVAGTALMASGQEPASTPKKKPSLSPDTAEVRFADGSTVRMFLTESAIEVTTRYGKLSVPVGEIRRIEFGFRYPEGVQARIDAAIGKLAEQDTKICEAAEKELLGFRELAYPSLKRTAAGTNRELARRAHGVIRKLEESVGAEKLKARDLDMIHAGEFTVAGKIDAPTLKGRTTYFGEVTLQVVQVRSIRFLAASGAETDLVVDAARYAALSQDVWLDTEVDVAEGAGARNPRRRGSGPLAARRELQGRAGRPAATGNQCRWQPVRYAFGPYRRARDDVPDRCQVHRHRVGRRPALPSNCLQSLEQCLHRQLWRKDQSKRG